MSKTVADLALERATAGAAYAAAAQAYVDAWVELAAYDLLGPARGGSAHGPAAPADVAEHRDFLRDRPAVLSDPIARAHARLQELIAELA